MFLEALPTKVTKNARGQDTTLTPREQAQADAFRKKTGIEGAIPYIVAISGVLTIATLALALNDRKAKRGT